MQIVEWSLISHIDTLNSARQLGQTDYAVSYVLDFKIRSELAPVEKSQCIALWKQFQNENVISIHKPAT